MVVKDDNKINKIAKILLKKPKNTKSEILIYLKIRAIRKFIFIIFKAKIIFNYLRQIFSKAFIFQYFNLEYHI